MKQFVLVLVLLRLLIAGSESRAQWIQTNGPYSEDVTAFAVSGHALFTGTNGSGVYYSPDDGASWISRSDGLSSASIFGLAVSGSTLYSATIYGVLSSPDSGKSWYTTGFPFQTISVSLAANANEVFAGTDGAGLFRTSDQGISWTKVDSGLTNKFIHSIILLGNTLFVGTGGGGVFRSTDNGRSWTSASSGLFDTYVYALALQGGILYAGTDSERVYRSSDEGRSWVEFARGFPTRKGTVVALAANGPTVFAGTSSGLFVSNDSGASWLPTTITSYTNAITIIDGRMLAGTENGMFESTSEGADWYSSNKGLGFTSVTSLLPKGEDLFAGTYYGGVFESTNSGQDWIARGLSYSGITSLVQVDSLLIAGCNSQGIYRSSDQGLHWVAPLVSPMNVNALLQDSNYLYAGADDGVYLSIDSGQVWGLYNTGLPNYAVNALKSVGPLLLAGTNEGVYISSDRGWRWTATDLTNVAILSFTSIADTIFAGAFYYGVYRSIDHGITWTPVIDGLTDGNVLSMAARGNTLFAGTRSGVFVSANQGEKWYPLNDHLNDTDIQALVVVDSELYAGVYFGGVWQLALSSQESVQKVVTPGTTLVSTYPNPFNAKTTITFSTERASAGRITITDPAGRSTELAASTHYEPGEHRIEWNASGLPNGIYLCRVQLGDESFVQKLCVLH